MIPMQMTMPMTGEQANINMECLDADHIMQLFNLLRGNKGLKLTISFGDEEEAAAREEDVGKYLLRLGISRHLNGYNYIRTGIRRCLEDPGELESITKLLYPAIAKKHKTTPGRVEHSIRHAIGLAWQTGDPQEWERLLGFRALKGKGRPTNTEFLAALTDQLLLARRQNIF